MKKVVVLLVILVLCIQLFSCQRNSLPLTSDNFPKDFVTGFSDNYRMVDPQLAYVSDSPWEVEMKVDNDEKLYLSLIDNVDKAHFISATEREDYYMGAPSYSVFVYQTAEAPIPMKDWTIRSIRVLEITPFAETNDNFALLSEKYMETILASSTVLHTYDNDNDNDSDFLDMIKSAYSAAEKFERRPTSVTHVDKRTDYSQPAHFCSLLIEFNECDNIFWHSYLFEDSDNLYFECTMYDADDVERKSFSMAKISAEFVEEIRGLIEAS